VSNLTKVSFKKLIIKDVITEKKEKEDQEKAPNKRVRGSESQAKVVVMAESEPSIEGPKKEVMKVTIPMKVPIKN
jgi:hypothetical protein